MQSPRTSVRRRGRARGRSSAEAMRPLPDPRAPPCATMAQPCVHFLTHCLNPRPPSGRGGNALGANAVQPSYAVTWTATIARAGPYYTVAKLGRLTIQALKAGILITAPVANGDVNGDFIEGASPDGIPVSWQLTSGPVASTLSLDGTRVVRRAGRHRDVYGSRGRLNRCGTPRGTDHQLGIGSHAPLHEECRLIYF